MGAGRQWQLVKRLGSFGSLGSDREPCGPGTVVARRAAGEAKIVVESLARRLGQLEANGPARLPLPHGSPVVGIPIGRDVINAQGHEVAAAELAVAGATCRGGALRVWPRRDRAAAVVSGQPSCPYS